MSAPRPVATAALAPRAAVRPPATRRRADAPALARRAAGRLGEVWLPRASWAISRTGRAGLVGIALLLAAAVFLFSTYLRVAAEVEALRADVAAANGRERAEPPVEVADPAAAIRALPARTEFQAILRQLFGKATQARLALETGKYEVNSTRTGDVVRYRVAFPVTGTYPQIRTFIDSTLATMPAVALDELVLARRSIADPSVEAQLRMTLFTAASGTTDLRRASEAYPSSDRVVPPRYAAALFAQHSWVVLKPAPPPPPPPPPAAPTAPPLPFTLVGSFTPQGDKPVYFLAAGDRVIDAHVGDVLDGVYKFESAADGRLVFVYLPLAERQTMVAGGSR